MQVIVKEQQPQEVTVVAAAATADVLAAFGGLSDLVVHDVVIADANGNPLTFHIKQHSLKEISYIESKRYRKGKNGQLIQDQHYSEVWGTAWEIHMSVVTNKGSESEPEWVPLWSLEQIAGSEKKTSGGFTQPAKLGILDSPNVEVKRLVNELCANIWRLNPELDPTVKAAAIQNMQALGIA